jgi:hypothetical protein
VGRYDIFGTLCGSRLKKDKKNYPEHGRAMVIQVSELANAT